MQNPIIISFNSILQHPTQKKKKEKRKKEYNIAKRTDFVVKKKKKSRIGSLVGKPKHFP